MQLLPSPEAGQSANIIKFPSAMRLHHHRHSEASGIMACASADNGPLSGQSIDGDTFTRVTITSTPTTTTFITANFR